MQRARRRQRHGLAVVREVLKPELVVPGPGQCVLHNIGGRLLVERADALILLAEVLVAQVTAGRAHPDLHLDADVLIIDAQNGRVAYRVGPPDGSGYRLARLI